MNPPTSSALAQAYAEPTTPALSLVEPRRDPVDDLTRREREVLSLIAEGHGNAVICATLFIAPKTLERHVQNIFLKLDLPPTPGRHRRVCAVLAWLRSPLCGQVFPAAVGDRAGCVCQARANGEEQPWMQHA